MTPKVSRRGWVFALLFALLAVSPGTAGALVPGEDALQPLAPLFVDLAGWDGDLVEWHKGEGGGTGYLSRRYVRDEALFDVMLLLAEEAEAYLGGMLPGVQLMENERIRLERVTLGSADVVLRREKESASGAVAVELGARVPLLLVGEYENLQEDEAVALLKSFDWGEIRRRAAAVLSADV